jgi:protein dithiol oxidoreductase (disulfide-forming)
MRHALPILICSLLLAACGSHSGANDQTAATTTPTTTASAAKVPASTPATASTASGSTAAAPAASSAQPAGPASTSDATASDSSSGNANSLTKAQRAQAEKIYQQGKGKWVAGTNYYLISPSQPTVGNGSGVEVVEVFSWGCPACNAAHPIVDSLSKSLPDFAHMEYLPAAFRPDENWVVYQRAFYAAKALGVARKAYDAVFDATWKSGELATYDLSAGRPKPRSEWPHIGDFAKFFAKHFGVDAKQFVAVANSFSINTQMKRADELVKAYGVPGTPTFVVNGGYRFDFQSAGSASKAVELAQWLAAKAALGK